ncbi:MAG: glycosyltransferase family 4 protein [Flavobacteriaceae bacterium]|nr:glycosyltransferase family 4 protein [Flavobacteriaceae bacterium]
MQDIFLESHHLKNMHFGFGQFNYHLLKAIHKLNYKDFNITIHADKRNPVLKEFDDYYKIKTYYPFRRYPFFRIRKKYDLWHSLNQNTKIEPGAKTPYLLTVHNISYIQDHEDYRTKKNHLRFQDKLNRSQAITYISNYAKSSTHQFFNVPEVPEYVIYNGNPIFKVELPEDHQPNLKTRRPFLFSIGEFTDRKNFQSLIPMMTHLKDFDLILAGKDHTKNAEKVRQAIEHNKLKDRVFLAGKISELDKQYYYKNCSGFVFPSLREGFGLPVIEAMKFGKVVFLSNNTSLPEVGGPDAFYWDNYNPEEMADVVKTGYEKYLNDQSQYESKYIKRAESFNWTDSAKAYLDVYRSLLNH